jgi:hypothetical protein
MLKIAFDRFARAPQPFCQRCVRNHFPLLHCMLCHCFRYHFLCRTISFANHSFLHQKPLNSYLVVGCMLVHCSFGLCRVSSRGCCGCLGQNKAGESLGTGNGPLWEEVHGPQGWCEADAPVHKYEPCAFPVLYPSYFWCLKEVYINQNPKPRSCSGPGDATVSVCL